ncbi:hypothetical protein A9995_06920 [Erythrobacter sp. QSSC1-22B]|nr:hypothetical protein A9995_06920 [Erythrobacter sp. QSSC1-22B]
MAENEICSFLDADSWNDDRFVVKLLVGDSKAIIFRDSLVQTMLPLIIVHVDFRPRRHQENLFVITLEER